MPPSCMSNLMRFGIKHQIRHGIFQYCPSIRMQAGCSPDRACDLRAGPACVVSDGIKARKRHKKSQSRIMHGMTIREKTIFAISCGLSGSGTYRVLANRPVERRLKKKLICFDLRLLESFYLIVRTYALIYEVMRTCGLTKYVCVCERYRAFWLLLSSRHDAFSHFFLS